ncbi:Hypothetical predicted protein [Paramuricea clavata]|uniref:Uncharacterized protein n=1 Tax=Paramuricea clavata TaxID=317549 RepID=A0A6S7JXX4_PARCT|nr:Hypothetical predicted protein [Paramuricea clavata]
MSKRAFPFNSCAPLQLKTHVENKHVNNDEASMQKIYAKTQSILKAGAKAQSEKASAEENNVPSTNICENCKKTSKSVQLARCSFCDKTVCVYCFNVCYKCEQNFCPLCSVISYDDRVEKSYCLSCIGS